MTNKMRFVLYLFASLLATASTSSAEKSYTVSKGNPCIYENGMDVSGTSEMIDCAAYEGNKDRIALDTVWQCVISKYKEGLAKSYMTQAGYNSLLEEQAAWEKFLKSACHAYTYDFGREGHIHFQGCKASLIRQRTNYLNQFLDPSTEDTCLGNN